jgi:hypothetical protein
MHQFLLQSKKKTAALTHQMLQEAFGDNAMNQSKTFLWYKRFDDGRTSVDVHLYTRVRQGALCGPRPYS